MTLQFALRVIRVHQICNRSSVFGELVQASQHLSNIRSDTSVQKNQQAPPGVNSWKKKKKKKKSKIQNKNIAELFSKSTYNAERIKIPVWQKSRSHHSDKEKKKHKKAKWNGRRVCIKFR